MQSNNGRYHALDAVRAFALLLGIVLHATMPWLEGVTSWPTTERPNTQLALVWYVIHVFRMPLFLLIAGFFGHMAIERRGTMGFLRDRAKRILVPLLAAGLLMPVVLAIAYVTATLLAGGTLADVERGRQERASQAGTGLGHLWFLYYLLQFYAVALLARSVMRGVDAHGRIMRVVDRAVAWCMKSPWGVIALAGPSALYFYCLPTWSAWSGLPTPFSLVPNVGALLGYGVPFCVGWLVFRQKELLLGLDSKWGGHCVVALICTLVCLWVGGLTPHWTPYLHGSALAVYTAAYMIGAWSWTLGLLGVALKFLSAENKVRRYVADSSYWLYLAHVPVLVFFLRLFQSTQWHWSVEFSLTLAASLPVLLLSYHFLIRPTFLGALLNGRKVPRAGFRPARAARPSAPPVATALVKEEARRGMVPLSPELMTSTTLALGDSEPGA